MAVSYHSFDRFRELKAMGEIALAADWQMGKPMCGLLAKLVEQYW
jgi:hypothetical protein